jgi:hypothetical protein
MNTFNDWLRFQEFAKDKVDGLDGFLMVRDLDRDYPGTVCIPIGKGDEP